MVTRLDASPKDAARARLVVALERTAAGDRAALREVYDLTAAKLFGVCLRICQDREAAEDVMQQVYLKIWHRAGRFEADRASPITWLSAIAHNAAIDWRRSNGRVSALPIEAAGQVADPAPNAEQRIDAEREHARVLDCIDALEARQRTAIRSAFFDGLTYAELSQRAAVPLGTMKSWIRRGLIRLHACLSDG